MMISFQRAHRKENATQRKQFIYVHMYFYSRFSVLSIKWSSLLAFFLFRNLSCICFSPIVAAHTSWCHRHRHKNQIMPQINNWPYRVRLLPSSTGITRLNSTRRGQILLLHCKLMNSLFLNGILRLRSFSLFFQWKMAIYIFCMGTTYVIQDVNVLGNPFPVRTFETNIHIENLKFAELTTTLNHFYFWNRCWRSDRSIPTRTHSHTFTFAFVSLAVFVFRLESYACKTFMLVQRQYGRLSSMSSHLACTIRCTPNNAHRPSTSSAGNDNDLSSNFSPLIRFNLSTRTRYLTMNLALACKMQYRILFYSCFMR